MEQFINKVIQGDCLDKLKELEDNSIDSIVTDPGSNCLQKPYNIHRNRLKTLAFYY